ncbi:hypothetical protein RJP21_29765 [Paenibacillus sp. VCA1]|uniref:hypothetical protein n=1 Tax=Paenibacillus sp. VCA1 TaxID=3039148 RepID=UPI002871A685|nr:hypothetical protein [Paenibacillus sp. VCA1]MDR9857783.1 hypothetical protein [Paenibacillus sp. VCA1]
MQTVKLSELLPRSYINFSGEIITKEQAEEIIATGQKPVLYTVSDEWIQGALMKTSREFKETGSVSEVYSAPDPHAARILY